MNHKKEKNHKKRKKTVSDKNVLVWIVKRISKRWPKLLGVVAANAGAALFGVWFALRSRAVIDTAVEGDQGGFFLACIFQLVVICAMLVCVTANRYLTDRLLSDLDRDRKQQLLHCLLRADYAQVSKFHSGELIHRLNNDVRELNEGIVGVLPGFISMAVRLCVAIWALAAMVPGLTVVMAAAGIVVLLSTAVLRGVMKRRQQEVKKTEGRVLSFLQEAAERLLLIRSMGFEQEVERRAETLLENRTQAENQRRLLSVSANTAVSVMFHLLRFIALIWCASALMSGSMSFGTLAVVTQLVGQLQLPFVRMSGVLPRYVTMCAAGERLMEIEQMEIAEAKVDDKQNRLTDISGMLVGENVSFAYGNEAIFSNASFHIPVGAFTAITGISGIGKSTLLKLLLGVYKPDSGRLLLEEEGKQQNLSEVPGRVFAYVPQGNLLFSGTLRENIMLARPDASKDDLDRAVYASGVDQFLEQLPQGLDTVLGESGEGLSEGQAQRLAIARAVISGAPILLLDEATSALDAQTERLVLSRLAQLPGCTCIAVSHRAAALEIAIQQLEVCDQKVLVKK